MDTNAILAIVTSHLEPVLARMGLRLYDLELHLGRGGSVLRVFIDRPEGVNVEDCARVSNVLSTVLDVEDPIPGTYNLEVSSPGLTRKLTKPRHYEGSVGQLAKLELRQPIGERRSLRGELRGFSGSGSSAVVEIEVEGQTFAVPLAEVAKAQLVLPEPETPPKPRKGSK